MALAAEGYGFPLREIAAESRRRYGEGIKDGIAMSCLERKFPEGPAERKLAKIFTNYASTATGELRIRCVYTRHE
jgi:hypothetical protein